MYMSNVTLISLESKRNKKKLVELLFTSLVSLCLNAIQGSFRIYVDFRYANQLGLAWFVEIVVRQPPVEFIFRLLLDRWGFRINRLFINFSTEI